MPRNESYVIKNNHLYHYGGDKVLCENFVEIMKGGTKSKGSLDAGLISALMCLYADKSAKTNQFYDIKF